MKSIRNMLSVITEILSYFVIPAYSSQLLGALNMQENSNQKRKRKGYD